MPEPGALPASVILVPADALDGVPRSPKSGDSAGSDSTRDSPWGRFARVNQAVSDKPFHASNLIEAPNELAGIGESSAAQVLGADAFT